MISLQRSMHSSQMYTPGPAISFLTCFCDLPQKEHFNRSPPSPNLAIWSSPLVRLPRLRSSTAGAGPLGGHDEVAVGVAGDLLDVLAGVGGDDLVQHAAHPEDLAGLDLDVDRLALGAARGLVDQDAGVGQPKALARRPGGQQDGGRRGGLAHAGGGHVRLHVLHGVVDRQQRRDRAARRVDVQLELLVGVLALQVEQLGHEQVGDGVVDRRAEEDDPLVQQPRVDVERALAAVGLLDDDRDQIVRGGLHRRYSLGSEASSGAASYGSACSTRNAKALLRRISPRITPARPPARALRTSSGSRPARSAWGRRSASTCSLLWSVACVYCSRVTPIMPSCWANRLAR